MRRCGPDEPAGSAQSSFGFSPGRTAFRSTRIPPMVAAPSPATNSMRDNRRHHKVPVALLGRFTEDGTDEGVLHVLDAVKGTWRRSTPGAECRERGYYSVDAHGVAPSAPEDFLATDIEGPAAPILKALGRSQA